MAERRALLWVTFFVACLRCMWVQAAPSSGILNGDIVSSNHLSQNVIHSKQSSKGPLKVVSSNYARDNSTAPIPMKKAPTAVPQSYHLSPNATNHCSNATNPCSNATDVAKAPVGESASRVPTPAPAPASASASSSASASATASASASENSTGSSPSNSSAPVCRLLSRDCRNGGAVIASTCSCKCKYPYQGPNCAQCQYPWKGPKCEVCPLVDPLSPQADHSTTAKISDTLNDGMFSLQTMSWKQIGKIDVSSGGHCVFAAEKTGLDLMEAPTNTSTVLASAMKNRTLPEPSVNATSGAVLCGLSQTVQMEGIDKMVPFSVVLVAKGKSATKKKAVHAQLRIQMVYTDGKMSSHPKDIIAHMPPLSEAPSKTSVNIDPLLEPYALEKGSWLKSFVVKVEASGGAGEVTFVQAGIAAPDPCDRGRRITEKCACGDCPEGWTGKYCNVPNKNLLGHTVTRGPGSIVSTNKRTSIPYLKGGWKNETNPTHGPHGIPLISANIKSTAGASDAATTVDIGPTDANLANLWKSDSVAEKSSATKSVAAKANPAAANSVAAAANVIATNTDTSSDDLDAIASNALQKLKQKMMNRPANSHVAATPDVIEADVANAGKWTVVSENYVPSVNKAVASKKTQPTQQKSKWSKDAVSAASPTPKLGSGKPMPKVHHHKHSRRPPQTNEMNESLAREMEETLVDTMTNK